MNRIAVCVTGQKTCERLITRGVELARELNAELAVVHVAKNGADLLENKDTGAALDYLYHAAKRAGAVMYVERADNVLEALVDFLTKNKITHSVMGTQKDSQSSEFVRKLARAMPALVIDIVP